MQAGFTSGPTVTPVTLAPLGPGETHSPTPAPSDLVDVDTEGSGAPGRFNFFSRAPPSCTCKREKMTAFLRSGNRNRSSAAKAGKKSIDTLSCSPCFVPLSATYVSNFTSFDFFFVLQLTSTPASWPRLHSAPPALWAPCSCKLCSIVRGLPESRLSFRGDQQRNVDWLRAAQRSSSMIGR